MANEDTAVTYKRHNTCFRDTVVVLHHLVGSYGANVFILELTNLIEGKAKLPRYHADEAPSNLTQSATTRYASRLSDVVSFESCTLGPFSLPLPMSPTSHRTITQQLSSSEILHVFNGKWEVATCTSQEGQTVCTEWFLGWPEELSVCNTVLYISKLVCLGTVDQYLHLGD